MRLKLFRIGPGFAGEGNHLQSAGPVRFQVALRGGAVWRHEETRDAAAINDTALIFPLVDSLLSTPEKVMHFSGKTASLA
jgi:hypothetical protein